MTIAPSTGCCPRPWHRDPSCSGGGLRWIDDGQHGQLVRCRRCFIRFLLNEVEGTFYPGKVDDLQNRLLGIVFPC